jgi:outer membrane receptor protein involved in Fe transport
MNFRSFVTGAAALVTLVTLVPWAAAQSTGSIQGTVYDPAGAAIANAKVVVTNTGTGEIRETASDSSGAYAAPSLVPGTYTVVVSAPGFETASAAKVTLSVGVTVTEDFHLVVGSTSQTMEVAAAAPLVDTTTTGISAVVNQREVQQLPLNGRHFVDLGLIIPGSVTPPQSGFLTFPIRGQGSLSFNTAGSREDTVNFMINGINLNDMLQNQITFQPTINTVSEFKTDNSTFEPQYGRNSGAIVNIATRAGTNDFHGELYEYLRNNDMDARNYFNRVGTPMSPFKRNQFGADIGGPIWQNHTFYFLTYEGLRQRQGLTLDSGVLSNAQRTAAQAIGNPTVLKLLPFIPAPNFGTATFLGSATAPVNIDQGTANVSHVFSDRDQINFYYAGQFDHRQEPTLQGNTIPNFGDTRDGWRELGTLNETHVFSPTLTNEARFGINHIHITFAPNQMLNPATFDINNGVDTAIGLPQITVSSIGLNFGGPAGFPQGRGDSTGVLSDTVSWVHGRHTFAFGGEFRRFINDNFGNDPGTFTFSNVTNFINGEATGFTVNTLPSASRIGVNSMGAFAQDSWKVRPYFTINYGIRYDWNGTPVEARNRFVVFNPATVSLVQAGLAGNPEVYQQNDKLFQPRAGIAWDLTHDGKTILRANYAVLTDQPVTNLVSGLASNPPFSNPVSFAGPGTVAFGNALATAKAAGSLSPSTVNQNFTDPIVQDRNLTISREITPTSLISVGYIGQHATHLRISENLNQPINGVRPHHALSASSPIDPGALLGNIAAATSDGKSDYNALWVTFTKRYSNGLQLDATYTWSKSLDFNSLSSQGVVVQNSYNVAGDWGLSDFNAAHRFVLDGTYELPFKGNPIVRGWRIGSIMQFQTGNPFNINTLNGALSGYFNSRPTVLGPIVTKLGSAPDGNPRYIFGAVCTTPTPGCSMLIPTTFGDLGRNVLIGPGFADVDASLAKDFHFLERYMLEFRVDAFDMLNHPNFGQPNHFLSTSPTSTFGEITSTRFPVGDSGSSRQLQVSLDLQF